jgi:protein-S-isoprenylcysteine O-methyltransferase Ste14
VVLNSIIRYCAIGFGAIALIVPILSVLRNSRREHGRVLGKGATTRSWPVVLLTTVLLAGIGLLLWRPFPWPFDAPAALAASILGAVLYFPGIALYLWGIRVLNAHFGVSGLFGAELYKGHALVNTGPFRIVRHPMYLGVLVAAAGALLIHKTWAMLLFTPVSLIVIFRAEMEEKLLSGEFGEAWKTYASETPKWIPRVFRGRQ